MSQLGEEISNFQKKEQIYSLEGNSKLLLENFILGIFEDIIRFKSINFQSSSFFEGKPFLLKSFDGH